jgi:hypothetical protein
MFLTLDDLKNDTIYKENLPVFNAKTGAGYWAWKPWAILKAMEQANVGDVVIYQDCGKGFKYKNFLMPHSVIEYAQSKSCLPGMLVPIHGKNKDWTHSRCFQVMNCMEDIYLESPQVEAALSAWVVNEKNLAFLKEWLKFCLNIDAVGDMYSEKGNNRLKHRYDQSILTNLSIKHKLKPYRIEYSNLHFTKSLSFVELNLRNNKLSKTIISAISFLLKIKLAIGN